MNGVFPYDSKTGMTEIDRATASDKIEEEPQAWHHGYMERKILLKIASLHEQLAEEYKDLANL